MAKATRRPVIVLIAVLAALCVALAVGAAIHPQLAPLLAVAVAVGTLILTGRKDSLERTRYSVERFKAPIEHLDSSSAGLRLGGVQELDHIMQFSDADRDRALALLCGFLRIWTARGASDDPSGPLAIEVVAALDSLRRRRRVSTEAPLNLEGMHTPRANLSVAFLANALLAHADLAEANLREAELQGANLTRANLTNADLTKADLRGARIYDTRLAGADLTKADLRGADLTDAMLTDATLFGADLSDVAGLTPEQLADAHTDPRTRLPW